jgi:hypothetical protein
MKILSANKKDQFLLKNSLLPIITGLLCFVFFISCNNNTENKAALSDLTTADTLLNKTISAEKKGDYVLIKVDNLRVRDNPNTSKSTVVASLSENTYWEYTGKQSDQKEKITLREQEFDTYWYNIKVGDCTNGWVYGGAIEFVEKPISISTNATIFFPESVAKLLNKDTLKEVTSIVNSFDKVNTAKGLFAYYNKNHERLGELLEPLINDIHYGEHNLTAADLNCALGAFKLAELCSECGTQLYIDNGVFLAKAKETSEKIDDEIFQLMYDAVGNYNSFSVGKLSKHECDFCWFSILGDGQILGFWKRVAKIWEWRLNHLSEVEIEFLMGQIADYLLSEMGGGIYMYSQEKVLAEYAEIVKVLKTVDWQKAKDIAFDTAKLRAQIQKGKGITFDCEHQDCGQW